MSESRPHVQATIPDMLDLVTKLIARCTDRFGDTAERTELILNREEVGQLEALARFLSPAASHAAKISKIIHGGR